MGISSLSSWEILPEFFSFYTSSSGNGPYFYFLPSSPWPQVYDILYLAAVKFHKRPNPVALRASLDHMQTRARGRQALPRAILIFLCTTGSLRPSRQAAVPSPSLTCLPSSVFSSHASHILSMCVDSATEFINSYTQTAPPMGTISTRTLNKY